MNWLLGWTMLFSIFGLSLQNCPYADLQGLYHSGVHPEPATHAASNIIHNYAEHSELLSKYSGPLKPVPEGGLTGKDIDTLVQNYFSPNSGRHNVHLPGNSHEGTFDSFFNSFVGASPAAELACAIPPTTCANDSANYYFRTFDGSCNNLAYPGFGMAKSRYTRLLAPKYGDGKYSPSQSVSGQLLPNPRLISLSVFGDEAYPDNFLTYLSMQFGQYVGHDLSKLSINGAPKDCCAESSDKLCYPIPLVPYGPISLTSGKKCLHFARAVSDYDISCPPSGLHHSEKISTDTAYLDLSTLYGNSLEGSIKLRKYTGGLLKAQYINHRTYLPLQANINGECRDGLNECYNIPDNRNDFTIPIAVLQTIFMREHNRIATILAQLNPQYSDEKLFQIARKITTAVYQKILYYEWLPLVLGRMHSYENNLIYQTPPHEYVNDYDQTLEAAAYAESASAAFRYSHHRIPGFFSLVSPGRDRNQTLRLSDYSGRRENIPLMQEGRNFDDFVRGMTTQMQKRSDDNIDKELKHHFNRKPFDDFGTDLKAIDIQRNRDFGLASYNDLRQYCGLPRAYDWSGFRHEISPEHIALLQKFYATPNDVDLTVGGALEAHVPEAMFGPTFHCIVTKQFLRARRSDRFFFEREDLHAGFTRDQLASIRSVSVAGLLCENGNNVGYMQPNAFVAPSPNNDLVSCNSIPKLNLGLWKDHDGY